MLRLLKQFGGWGTRWGNDAVKFLYYLETDGNADVAATFFIAKSKLGKELVML